ncbi:hypothetical protein C8R47DRAFT_1205126 [Mycena vitilis]|nr:hypothetical protein C8R47DRAFT_1205126 [Mycena vitilis]
MEENRASHLFTEDEGDIPRSLSQIDQDDDDMPSLCGSSDQSDDGDEELTESVRETGTADAAHHCEIGTDDAAHHCDMCQKMLPPDDADSRVFRCYNCELSVQCETCCSGKHMSRGRNSAEHMLQEWNHFTMAWSDRQTVAAFLSTMVKTCGKCDMQLATQSVMLPEGVIMCMDCGPLLLCHRCCIEGHQESAFALHNIRVWSPRWERSTLADEGLVVRLGHKGGVCIAPAQPLRSMSVISIGGLHRVNMSFCGCGQFEAGAAGDWAQIRAYGWFRASLMHPLFCATFEVMTRASEMTNGEWQ